MSRLFRADLVPTVIAYHLAHYLSCFLLLAQLIIPLASVPFGWGWNLFGTSGYMMDIGIITAKFICYLSISTIVAGYLIVVYLAHTMALQISLTVRAALFSQVPMIFLMPRLR